jgi:hypothetical protein
VKKWSFSLVEKMCENRTHLDVNESIQMKRIKIKIEDDFK